MDDQQMWSLLVGFLAPPVISVVQQPKWSARLRVAVTTVICIIAGLVTAAVTGDLDDRTEATSSVLVVLLAAMTFYKRFWTPTGVSPAIEAATSPSARVEPVVHAEPTAVETGPGSLGGTS